MLCEIQEYGSNPTCTKSLNLFLLSIFNFKCCVVLVFYKGDSNLHYEYLCNVMIYVFGLWLRGWGFESRQDN